MRAKKILAGVGACLMASSMAIPAFAAAPSAANTSAAIIDQSKKGTLTIHKIIENTGRVVEDDGIVNARDAQTGAITVVSPDKVKGEENGSNSTTLAADQDGATTVFGGSANGKLADQGQSNGVANAAAPSSSEGTASLGVTSQYEKNGNTSGFNASSYQNAVGINDIKFGYFKIADIASVAGTVQADNSQEAAYQGVGTYFTNMDSDFLALASGLGITMKSKTINNKAYYETAEVEAVIAQISNMSVAQVAAAGNSSGKSGEELLAAYVKQKGTEITTATVSGEDGVASASNLPLGLYLVAETDISAHDGLDASGNPLTREDSSYESEMPIIESNATPFLVSLPNTNVSDVTINGTTYAPGTLWLYDQDVYPKDQTTSITKKIVDTDVASNQPLRDREDYQIGDTIRQVIWADAPVLQGQFDTTDDTDADTTNVMTAGRNRLVFGISDKMSKTLSLASIVKVAVGDKVANPMVESNFSSFTPLTLGDDYIVCAYDTAKEFPLAGQQPVSIVDNTGKVLVTDGSQHDFSIYLTQAGIDKMNARTTDSQVIVYFDSVLNNDAAIGTGVSADSELNTNYGTLTWENSNTSLKSINSNKVYDYTHQLNIKKDGLADPTAATFVVARGQYNSTIATAGTQAGTNTADAANATNPLSTQTMTFVKESDGVYHLFDNSIDQAGTGVTELHPDASGNMTIKGIDSDCFYTVKEIATQDGHDLLKDTFDIWVTELDPKRTGAVEEARVKISNPETGVDTDVITDLTIDQTNKGIVSMEVDNYKTVTLHTGGAGRTMIYITGAGLAMILTIGIVASKRRKEEVA